jgi:hypothetical protein
MSQTASLSQKNLSGDIWGGFAAMLVALPSAIACGVTIFSPLGADFGAKGALAGMLGVTALGLIAATFGGTQRLISAPCAPAAAVLSALTIQMTQQGSGVGAVVLTLFLVAFISSLVQISFGERLLERRGLDHRDEPVAQVDGLAQRHELVARLARHGVVAASQLGCGCGDCGLHGVGASYF